MESLHTAAIPIAGSNVQYSRFQHRDAQTKPGLPPAAKGARDPFFQPGQSIIAGPGTNFLSGAADRERSYRLPFPERTMTFQLKQGKHFHPVGWDLVRNEAILKQEKLQVGSVAMVGDWRKEGNWHWFSNNGFQDPYDVEARNRVRFPQRPYDFPKPAAGHRPTHAVEKLYQIHAASGRDKFLDRGQRLSKATSLPHLQSSFSLGMVEPAAKRATPPVAANAGGGGGNADRTS